MNERFLRQIDILKPEVCNCRIYIIGVGATGSFVALSLAKMGLSDLWVYDADIIEEHNFPNQIFPVSYLGKNKAKSLKEIINFYTGISINAFPYMYKRQPLKDIVISTVDTMKDRKKIYKNAKKGKAKLLIDPKSGPEIFRLLTIDMSLEIMKNRYENSLHLENESDIAPCTGRSIIYGVLMLSAYICKQIKSYLMKEEYSPDITLDMRNNLLFK